MMTTENFQELIDFKKTLEDAKGLKLCLACNHRIEATLDRINEVIEEITENQAVVV